MKRLFKFKHPKIVLLAVSIIVAYFVFRNPDVQDFVLNLGYFGAFIAGMLFSSGFTAPFAAGYFIVLEPNGIFNLLIFAFIGGLGAMVFDLIIFKFIRLSFTDEFEKLKNTRMIKKFDRKIEKKIGHKLTVYLMYTFAGILISSPLPDEIGIIMLAGLTKIDAKHLAKISFALNTLGIFILLNL